MRAKDKFKAMAAGLAGLMLSVGVATTAAAGPVTGQGTWETTLQARDLDGNAANGPEAFYDTALNLTWLRAGSTNTMNWAAAKSWAAQDRYGLAGWRLPTMVDTGTAGCNYSYSGGTDCGYNVDTITSEMAHLFYVSLGNLASCPPGDVNCSTAQPGWGLSNTGNFENLEPNGYWSGLEYAPVAGGAWYFVTGDGRQDYLRQVYGFYALAVRPGDVAATSVPEPQALVLALLALGALAVTRRRPL